MLWKRLRWNAQPLSHRAGDRLIFGGSIFPLPAEYRFRPSLFAFFLKKWKKRLVRCKQYALGWDRTGKALGDFFQ